MAPLAPLLLLWPTGTLSGTPIFFPTLTWELVLSAFSPPLGVSAPSEDLQPPLLPPAVHHEADRVAADVGAQPLKLGDPEGGRHRAKRIFHQIGGAEINLACCRR